MCTIVTKYRGVYLCSTKVAKILHKFMWFIEKMSLCRICQAIQEHGTANMNLCTGCSRHGVSIWGHTMLISIKLWGGLNRQVNPKAPQWTSHYKRYAGVICCVWPEQTKHNGTWLTALIHRHVAVYSLTQKPRCSPHLTWIATYKLFTNPIVF